VDGFEPLIHYPKIEGLNPTDVTRREFLTHIESEKVFSEFGHTLFKKKFLSLCVSNSLQVPNQGTLSEGFSTVYLLNKVDFFEKANNSCNIKRS
jgi:hypothetical protein